MAGMFGGIKPPAAGIAPAAAAPAAKLPVAPKPAPGTLKPPPGGAPIATAQGVNQVARKAAMKTKLGPNPQLGGILGRAAPSVAGGMGGMAGTAPKKIAPTLRAQGTGGAGFARPVVTGKAAAPAVPKVAKPVAKPKAAAKPKAKAAVSNRTYGGPRGAPTDTKHYKEGGQYKLGGEQYFFKGGQLRKVTGSRKS